MDEPAGDDDLVADAHREANPEERADGDAQRDRKDPQAGAQRRIVLEELEVLGDEEDEAGQREEGDRDRTARRREAQVAEEREVEHRVRSGGAPTTRRRHGDRRGERTRRWSAPAVHPRSGASMIVNTSAPMPTVDSTSPTTSSGGVDGSRDVGTNRMAATSVSAATGAMTTKTLPHQKCSSRKPPVTGPNATPSPVIAPHTPMAFARSVALGVQVRDDREGGGEDERGSDPHAGADDQQRTRGRRPARRPRSPPEDGEARDQGALAPVAVTEAAGGEHERGKGQVVGIDDPLEVARRRAELAHERGQGDVHDRRVDVDDEHGGAQDCERRAAVGRRVGGRDGSRCCWLMRAPPDHRW